MPLLIVLMVLMPVLALAQALADSIDNMEALNQIVSSLNGVHIAGLAGVALVVQCIMTALRSNFVVSRFGAAGSSVRLALVYLLSCAGGVLHLINTGMPVGQALFHASSMAAYQVLIHQAYTVYVEQKK